MPEKMVLFSKRRILVFLIVVLVALPIIYFTALFGSYFAIDSFYNTIVPGDTAQVVAQKTRFLRHHVISLSSIPAVYRPQTAVGSCLECKLFGPFTFIVVFDYANHVSCVIPLYE